ncbi:hypothetical protein Tco_1019460 [Tanacetum coccineum]|uniref:Uncharacterized protein n=1 Tax=Tanacetum coccineum TaxID=301880 RepID=A0ABQ5FYM9_9ASTR
MNGSGRSMLYVIMSPQSSGHGHVGGTDTIRLEDAISTISAEETIVDFLEGKEAPPANDPATTKVALELDLEKEVTVIGPPVNKKRHKRDKGEADANAPPNVLRKDHASIRPEQDTRGGKSLAAIGLKPDPLSYAKPQLIPEQDIAQSSKKATIIEDPNSEKSTSFTSMGRLPGSIYHPEELLEAEIDMKKAVEAKNAELVKELESLRV